VKLLLMAALILCPAASAAQQFGADDILRRMELKYEESDGFSYGFKQTKSIAQIDGLLNLEGTLTFRKPHFLKLELRGDENLNLYVDGKTIWLEDLDLEEVDSYDFEQLGSERRLSGLLPHAVVRSIEELEAIYDVELSKEEGKLAYLELTAKNPSERGPRECRFSVDRRSRLRWMKVVYGNGDFTETHFMAWRKIGDIPEEFFAYPHR
jgi:outer membrane lipoprotein-sorting protein